MPEGESHDNLVVVCGFGELGQTVANMLEVPPPFPCPAHNASGSRGARHHAVPSACAECARRLATAVAVRPRGVPALCRELRGVRVLAEPSGGHSGQQAADVHRLRLAAEPYPGDRRGGGAAWRLPLQCCDTPRFMRQACVEILGP